MFPTCKRVIICAAIWFFLKISYVAAKPIFQKDGGPMVVVGERYRATFAEEMCGFSLDVKGSDGRWHEVVKGPGAITFAHFDNGEHSATGLRTTWAVSELSDSIVIGQQIALDSIRGTVLDLHYICTDTGLLIGARLTGREPGNLRGFLWTPPRMGLTAVNWEGYLFWSSDGKAHEGRIADLAPCPAYAGVSPWGPQGDTVAALDPQHPALIVRSTGWGTDLGVVFVDYADRWAGSHIFLQRYNQDVLLLYGGYSPVASATKPLWAWLAPLPQADAKATSSLVEKLVREGEKLTASFHPISRPAPEEWTRPTPDFPAALRRPEPVRDINEAVVFTVNEETNSDYGVEIAKKIGSDVSIRGWFKWAQAPPVDKWKKIPQEVHKLGALFGGGITCSALYENENGISQAQLLDMATRGPAGQLIDAWDTPGIRHGSLSSPAYLDYLFRWCREQIDAGVDYLFMDEHTAAIGGLEGYDDHSLADFRNYLLHDCPQTRDWKPGDTRWSAELKIDLTDPHVCPRGDMSSFDYRAYLRAKGLLEKPATEQNPLHPFWEQFRNDRDDRAWKTLTDRIRAYAKEKGRTILISANGIAKYVDLQVLGVWEQWMTKGGHINLSENQLPRWRSLVAQGQTVAGKKAPVVFFHDWGFGDPPFPWMAVSPSEREVWMRTRGAEIYAAGGFFAFPVLGPFNCDASRDGTLAMMARQTTFYQAHRDLYLHGRYLSAETVKSNTGNLSLAVWRIENPRALIVHVINRNLHDGALEAKKHVTLVIPVDGLPEKATVVSPDWKGERPAPCHANGGSIEVTINDLDAYAVAILHYARDIDLTRVKDPPRTVPTNRWARPTCSEFRVRPDGLVDHADELNGFLQGMLHKHLRNPPTFLVHAVTDGKLLVKVRAVAIAGARLEYRVDGETKQTVDLPDLDGKNDGDAPEYDKVFTFTIPRGQHRLTLDNVGGDWAVVSWFEFQGGFGEWSTEEGK